MARPVPQPLRMSLPSRTDTLRTLLDLEDVSFGVAEVSPGRCLVRIDRTYRLHAPLDQVIAGALDVLNLEADLNRRPSYCGSSDRLMSSKLRPSPSSKSTKSDPA